MYNMIVQEDTKADLSTLAKKQDMQLKEEVKIENEK